MKAAIMFSAASFALVVTIPVSAWAQNTSNNARLILSRFSKCAVKANSGLARAAVLGRPGAPLGDRAFRQLYTPNCLSGAGELRMPATIIKGALAEELIHLKYHSGPVSLDPSTRPALDWSFDFDARIDGMGGKKAEQRSEAARQALTQESVLGRIGECVVRSNANEVVNVFQSPVDGPEELAAMKSLSPALSSCLSSGQTVAFDKTNLRSALARAYFRLAEAAPIGGVVH